MCKEVDLLVLLCCYRQPAKGRLATSLPVGLALQVCVMAPAVAGTQVGAMAPAVTLATMAPAAALYGVESRGWFKGKCQCVVSC